MLHGNRADKAIFDGGKAENRVDVRVRAVGGGDAEGEGAAVRQFGRNQPAADGQFGAAVEDLLQRAERRLVHARVSGPMIHKSRVRRVFRARDDGRGEVLRDGREGQHRERHENDRRRRQRRADAAALHVVDADQHGGLADRRETDFAAVHGRLRPEEQRHFTFETAVQDLDDERAQTAHDERDENRLGGLRHAERGMDVAEHDEREREEQAERHHLLLDFLELEHQLLREEAERQHQRQIEDDGLQHVVRDRRHAFVGLAVGADRFVQALQIAEPVFLFAGGFHLLDGFVAAFHEDLRQRVRRAGQTMVADVVQNGHIASRRRKEVFSNTLRNLETIAFGAFVTGVQRKDAFAGHDFDGFVLFQEGGNRAGERHKRLLGECAADACHTEFFRRRVQAAVQNQEGVLRNRRNGNRRWIVSCIYRIFHAVEQRQCLDGRAAIDGGGHLRLRIARVDDLLDDREIVVVFKRVRVERLGRDAVEDGDGAFIRQRHVACHDVSRSNRFCQIHRIMNH